MKLIIDVEKDYYEMLKYNLENGQKYKPWEIIANGIPYAERPHGEWKFSQGATTQGSLKCSCCGYRDYHITNSNFCPHCGANMRKGGRNENIN